MQCPICKAPFHNLTFDDQHVAHCINCGASYFEDNGINRISLETAKYLAKNKQVKEFEEPALKLCPYDNGHMQPVNNPDAIPSHVHLLACPVCDCVFAPAQDLVDFKSAQGAKINYIKSWRMPMGSLHGVLAVLVLAVISTTLYYTYQGSQQTQKMRIEASQTINNIEIVRSARFGIVSFTTSKPYQSAIILINKTTGETQTIPASTTPQTTHTATFTLPAEANIIYYRVQLEQNGKTINSPETPLELKE